MVPPISLSPNYSSTEMMSSFSVESNKVLQFLKEYKALECNCCSNIFGFQHRATGVLYCVEGCHEVAPPAQLLSAPGLSLQTQIATRPFGFSGLGNSPKDSGCSASTATNGISPCVTTSGSSPSVATSRISPPVVTSGISAPVPTSKVGVAKTAISTNGISPSASNGPAAAAAATKRMPTADAIDGRPTAAMLDPLKTVKESITEVKLVKPPSEEKLVIQPSKPPTTVDAPKKRHMWSQLEFSKKLTCANAQIHINFSWSPVKYAVSADDDEAAMNELQQAVKTFASKAQPMQQIPMVDEIVISEYEGEFYRARVKKVVEGEVCEIEFIDFGDKKSCKYTELIPVNDSIMTYPVFGMTVRLAKVPSAPQGFKVSEQLEEELFGNSYIIDQVQKGISPSPARSDEYEVRLWDLQREGTINENLTIAISAALRNK